MCGLEGELQLGGCKRSGSIYAVVFLLLTNKVVDEYTHSQCWLLLWMKYQILTELREVPALAQDPQPLIPEGCRGVWGEDVCAAAHGSDGQAQPG